MYRPFLNKEYLFLTLTLLKNIFSLFLVYCYPFGLFGPLTFGLVFSFFFLHDKACSRMNRILQDGT